MMTNAAVENAAPNRKDLIEALMSAWAMDEHAVCRTLSRTAAAEGVAVELLAASHVMQLGCVAKLLNVNEPQTAGI